MDTTHVILVRTRWRGRHTNCDAGSFALARFEVDEKEERLKSKKEKRATKRKEREQKIQRETAGEKGEPTAHDLL